jgi:uncharacterized protein YgiM (DUF1202 family)
MLFAKKDAPLKVDIPAPGDDRAITSKVGLIALVGFVVGVAWPRLLGVHVGPNPPGGGDDKVAAHPTEPSASAAASASAAPAPEASSDAAEAPQVSNQEQVVVSEGTLEACKNKKGEKQKECGSLSIDKVVVPKLGGLKDCASALGLDGEVTVALGIDFDKSTVDVLEDKKSGLPVSTVRGILKCAGDELKGLELEKIPHTHSRYTVAFSVKFYRPGNGPDEAKPEGDKGDEKGDAASGEGSELGKATVAWEKALVRESPKDGKVIARLPQGTRVKLLKKDDDWYEVSSGSTKGWLYRSAIGK